MKWLGTLVSALAVALITAIALAAFQNPIIALIGLAPLKASIEVVPWMDRPPQLDTSNAISITAENQSKKKPDPEFPDESTLVKISVENGGDKSVHNVRVAFSGSNDDSFYIPKSGSIKQPITGTAKEIPLGDLEPGQSATVYVWDAPYISTYNVEESVRVFSSEGKFQTLLKDRMENSLYNESPLLKFLEGWFPYFIAGIMVLLILLLFIIVSVTETYYKDLLSDDSFYVDEKVKFEEDFIKFKPDQSKLGKRFARFKARQSEKLL